MSYRLLLLAVGVAGYMQSVAPGAGQPGGTHDVAQGRRELEAWYEDNNRAFLAKDLSTIMNLRSAEFHTITPDGVRSDRAAMEQRTQGLLNGIEQWIDLSIEIDSLEVDGNEARAVVRQRLVRKALRPDGLVHHVETWVTQREVFRREAAGWRLYRVDNLRDQRRLVDGKPG
jgi:ketosteroid isomerase-like protein